jgi:hypothetical protein
MDTMDEGEGEGERGGYAARERLPRIEREGRVRNGYLR